jgi:hypothetical protein
VQETMRHTISRRGGAYALILLCTCSSNKPPVGDGHVDAPPPQTSAGSMDGGTDASVDGGADASVDAGETEMIMPHHPIDLRPISQVFEEDYGLMLTPTEKIIVDTCPPRPWSKNVPNRACTKDKQCGDGLCDRGHCRAIWTCSPRYGWPCKDSRLCEGVCFEGRCRSCVSDEECQQHLEEVNPDYAQQHKASCVPRGVGDDIPMKCLVRDDSPPQ